jgi:hypothetical protein
LQKPARLRVGEERNVDEMSQHPDPALYQPPAIGPGLHAALGRAAIVDKEEAAGSVRASTAMQSLPTERVPQSGPPGCALRLADDRRTGQVRTQLGDDALQVSYAQVGMALSSEPPSAPWGRGIRAPPRSHVQTGRIHSPMGLGAISAS